MTSFFKDGEDCVNIYSKGRTELGRLLSNFAHTPWVHPEHGEFASVEGFWYWLSTNHDGLRKLHGYAAKKFGRDLGGKDWSSDKDFKNDIKLAILCKLTQTRNLWNVFKESTLPLKHYYVYEGKQIEPKEGRWIVEFFEELRKT